MNVAHAEELEQIRASVREFALKEMAPHVMENDESQKLPIDILRALGEAALDEHAEWILMHRERPLEQTKL